jgi:hypothetical protein
MPARKRVATAKTAASNRFNLRVFMIEDLL